MNRKELGRITHATFGYGGYQDAQFGLSIVLEGSEWGTSSFKGEWSLDIDCSEHCKWTEEDRSNGYAEVVRFLNKTLKDAKKQHVDELVGVPIEAEFEGVILKSWRILTEVL